MTECHQLKGKDIQPLRDKILKEQKGICPICGKKIKKEVLDHEHKKKLKGTGQIRGVICFGCNLYLGRLENGSARYGIDRSDVPNILRRSAEYLEKEQYPFLHPSEKEKEPIVSKISLNKLQKHYKQDFPNKEPLKFVNNKKGVNKQKLNKKLDTLFKKYKIEIKFIK